MGLINGLLDLTAWFVIYGFLFVFFFFLVITVAMRDRDTKLKIREITRDIFKLIFR